MSRSVRTARSTVGEIGGGESAGLRRGPVPSAPGAYIRILTFDHKGSVLLIKIQL